MASRPSRPNPRGAKLSGAAISQATPETLPTEYPDPDQTCEWLATGPTLDQIASELRRLRIVHSAIGTSVDLLRSDALIRLGETGRPLGDEEPF